MRTEQWNDYFKLRTLMVYNLTSADKATITSADALEVKSTASTATVSAVRA